MIWDELMLNSILINAIKKPRIPMEAKDIDNGGPELTLPTNSISANAPPRTTNTDGQ